MDAVAGEWGTEELPLDISRAWLVGGVEEKSFKAAASKKTALKSIKSNTLVVPNARASSQDSGAEYGDGTETPMAWVFSSPTAMVGTAIEPRQRVIQACLGNLHGIMLTDAGIAFTWGDNRYGQLGRAPVMQEEGGNLFPVDVLLDEELVQVAAGKNHCLALSATGLVWAWGRNKSGQLGCGHFRDKVLPTPVCHVAKPGEKQEVQLGAGPGCPVLTINAGANCSIAATVESEVWQWGDINSEFIEDTGASGAAAHPKSGGGGRKERPFRVLERKAYRTEMRKVGEHISTSESGCRVLAGKSEQQLLELQDKMAAIQNWQEVIKNSRAELNAMNAIQNKKMAEARGSLGIGGQDGGAAGSAANDLQDTVELLSQHISDLHQDIEIYEKNMRGCEERQAHAREQLQGLEQHGIKLTSLLDKTIQRLKDETTDADNRQRLEDKLIEIKQNLQAKENSRLALIEQRSALDKEKTRASDVVLDKEMLLDKLTKRKQVVESLAKSTSNANSTDPILKFLEEQRLAIRANFEGKVTEDDFVLAMHAQEKDELYLNDVEAKVRQWYETLVNANPENAERAELIRDMLLDLIYLHRERSDIQADRWMKENLDITGFFESSARTLPERGNKPAEQDQWALPVPAMPALPWGE